MKILHLSDTHGCHHRLHDLPEADVAVHSGDFCMVGTEAEAIDFLNWFCDLPYRHKIFICGNHDDCLYGANIGGLDANVHYLCNSGTEINGVKFYGVPMFMHDCVTDRQQRNIARIPADTNVLVTHTPPHGILEYGISAATTIFVRNRIFGLPRNIAATRFFCLHSYKQQKRQPLLMTTAFVLRKDRDSNPGYSYLYNGFRDRPVRPLRHLSIALSQLRVQS